MTFGSSQGNHAFDESISEDGVLTWQSQPGQLLTSPTIRNFIEHDDRTDTIHLFLRARKTVPYVYCGTLGYLDHDRDRELPVHFQWQLMDWPAPNQVLADLGVVPTASLDVSANSPQIQDRLTLVPPPQIAPAGGGSSTQNFVARKQTRLPDQDARNAKLGLLGEQLVLMMEHERLCSQGRPDLADQLVHTAVVEGDGAGYDIKSYEGDGTPRYIEVKTTRGPSTTAFFISPNELAFSKAHPDEYVLIRVCAYDTETNSGSYYQVRGPVADAFSLVPTEYRAALKPAATAASLEAAHAHRSQGA